MGWERRGRRVVGVRGRLSVHDDTRQLGKYRFVDVFEPLGPIGVGGLNSHKRRHQHFHRPCACYRLKPSMH